MQDCGDPPLLRRQLEQLTPQGERPATRGKEQRSDPRDGLTLWLLADTGGHEAADPYARASSNAGLDPRVAGRLLVAKSRTLAAVGAPAADGYQLVVLVWPELGRLRRRQNDIPQVLADPPSDGGQQAPGRCRLRAMGS